MIQVGATQNVVISDCIAERASGTGISIAGNLANASVLIERCVASQTAGFDIKNNTSPALALAGVKVIDCVAEHNSGPAGFFLQPTTTTISDVVFKRCCAIGNSGSGFLVYLVGVLPATSISQLVFENCLAQGNAGDGFTLINTEPGGSIQGVLFSNCIAQGNTGGANPIGTVLPGDGFGIGSTAFTTGPIRDVICDNCIAQVNARDGFDLGSTTTLSKILACCSMRNTVTGINSQLGAANVVLANSAFDNGFADIVGVPDPSLVVSRSLTGAIAGATYWVNVVS
jgi:hypothetical protein